MRCLLFAVFLSLIASPVLAGPNESPTQFAVNPANPDFWALRYEFTQGGFVFSFDGGKTWKLTCNSAIDAVDNGFRADSYGLALASDGTVFSGDFNGMLTARDNGCSWTIGEGISDNWVSTLAQDALNPDRVLAATSRGDQPNGLWAYDTPGGTWAALGAAEMDVAIGSLITVVDDSMLRIYEGITRGTLSSGAPNFVIRYSTDEAATWTEYAFPEELMGEMKVVAVDQNDPARIAVAERYGRDDPRMDRLWLNEASADPGSFQLVGELGRFMGAAFDNNGVLYYGDRLGEMYKLDVGATTGTPIGDMLRPYCVAYEPTKDMLLMCQFNAFGQLDPDTAEYTEFVNFGAADSPISLLDCGDIADVKTLCDMQLATVGWCAASHYPYSAACEAYGFPGQSMLTGGTTASTGGGAMASGGAVATGGMSMTGGMVATGGVAATGGLGGGDAVTGGMTAADNSQGGGCSCRTSHARSEGVANLAAVVLALGLLASRRRRSL